MNSKVLEWLDEQLLSESLGGGIDIIGIKTRPAVPSGEHYLSTILRAEITFKKTSEHKTTHADGECSVMRQPKNAELYKTNIIVKTYAEGFLKQFIIDNELLTKEIDMYKLALPKISEILGKYITPEYLNSLNYDVLLLEDLKSSGFVVCDRIKKLDFEHCLRAIEILAEFHGATYTLNKQQPNSLGRVRKEVQYHKDNGYQKESIINSFRIVADEIKSWPECEKYSQRLRDSGESVWNSTVKEISPVDDKIMVLNHGDFWTNNILFRYERSRSDEEAGHKNSIKSIKLVDFQFSRWTTPAIDLHLFFKTSVRDKSFVPQLIVSYVEQLNKFIGKYNDCVTVDYINSELQRTECYAFLVSVFLLPMTLLNPSKALNFANTSKTEFVNAGNNPLANACKDTSFREIFPDILKYYEGIGLL